MSHDVQLSPAASNSTIVTSAILGFGCRVVQAPQDNHPAGRTAAAGLPQRLL